MDRLFVGGTRFSFEGVGPIFVVGIMSLRGVAVGGAGGGVGTRVGGIGGGVVGTERGDVGGTRGGVGTVARMGEGRVEVVVGRMLGMGVVALVVVVVVMMMMVV